MGGGEGGGRGERREKVRKSKNKMRVVRVVIMVVNVFLPHLGDVLFNETNNKLTARFIDMIEDFLNNIISILVSHHTL